MNYERKLIMKWKIPEKFLKKEKLILVLSAGILLVVINLPVKKNSKTQSTQAVAETTAVTENYAERIEESLENLLSRVNGVGKVSVAVTVKNTGENILYTENNSTSVKVMESDSSGGNRTSEENSMKQSVIYTDDGKYPYVVDTSLPEVGGVIIVAEGADDIRVVSEITDAVNALLGIPVNRIKVLKMEA